MRYLTLTDAKMEENGTPIILLLTLFVSSVCHFCIKCRGVSLPSDARFDLCICICLSHSPNLRSLSHLRLLRIPHLLRVRKNDRSIFLLVYCRLQCFHGLITYPNVPYCSHHLHQLGFFLLVPLSLVVLNHHTFCNCMAWLESTIISNLNIDA